VGDRGLFVCQPFPVGSVIYSATRHAAERTWYSSGDSIPTDTWVTGGKAWFRDWNHRWNWGRSGLGTVLSRGRTESPDNCHCDWAFRNLRRNAMIAARVGGFCWVCGPARLVRAAYTTFATGAGLLRLFCFWRRLVSKPIRAGNRCGYCSVGCPQLDRGDTPGRCACRFAAEGKRTLTEAVVVSAVRSRSRRYTGPDARVGLR